MSLAKTECISSGFSAPAITIISSAQASILSVCPSSLIQLPYSALRSKQVLISILWLCLRYFNDPSLRFGPRLLFSSLIVAIFDGKVVTSSPCISVCGWFHEFSELVILCFLWWMSAWRRWELGAGSVRGIRYYWKCEYIGSGRFEGK